ncbi:hypothetical protein CYLTODRAFT_374362 [Cylindrobasidium torrendii FP15055 ss-10]|uniref:Thioesterase domain-containing protein n=1 Tax=Cylindrobasidium torrendii FP15055 ss-10 TaxID=1314674 RepID=A0A0D7BFJ4_9AGAR|nr:hypothetical protein CYLTODRAFT_374362 [Cylindrobasidium torrendii FP15055 ss-10]
MADIAGNAPAHIKELFAHPLLMLGMMDIDAGSASARGFGKDVMPLLSITEASMSESAEAPSKKDARVICKLVVTDDMLNGAQTLHGGCSAYLVDACSTLAIILHAYVSDGRIRAGVSQSLTITYHSPALPGDELKIVNTTLSMGASTMVARTEIWNATRKRLVVTGVHIKMDPKQPKAKM